MKNYAIATTWSWGFEALLKGRRLLKSGCSALDAVEEAIRIVEDNPEANSVGTGGLPNVEGVLELDASIMDGTNSRAGAVACLQMTKNPISVARKVMELTPHVLLAGEGATKFARQCGFLEYDPLTQKARETWRKLREAMLSSSPRSAKKTFDELLGYDTNVDLLATSLKSVFGEHLGGTVGVLVRDREGSIAVGASTSGWPMRFPGRVADTAVIGAGTYASNVAAATATGVGENAIRNCLSKSVCDLVETGLSPKEACEEALVKMLSREKIDHLIAVICIDSDCNVGGAATKPGFRFQYSTSKHENPVIVRPEPVQSRIRRK